MDDDFPEYVEASLAALTVLHDTLAQGQRLGQLRAAPAQIYTSFVYSLLPDLPCCVLTATRFDCRLTTRALRR